MKEKVNKWMKWVVASVVLVVLVAGVLIGTLSKKDKGVDLIVTADGIAVEKGKYCLIEYKTSIKDAVVRFRIKDTAIAEESDGNILGKTVGETELVITARYKSMVYEKRVAVVVIEKNGEPSVDPNPEKPDPDNNDDDENKTDPKPPVEEMKVTLHKVFGCEVNDKTIEVTVGKLAEFQILTDELYSNSEVESNSEKLTVKESEDTQRLIMLKASEVGEYEITLKFDNKAISYTVIAKSL